MMKIGKNQAIIRNEGLMGGFDYFLIEIRYDSRDGLYHIHTFDDVSIDDLRKSLKGLTVDFSNRKLSAYTRPGYSLRDTWKAIPKYKKGNYYL